MKKIPLQRTNLEHYLSMRKPTCKSGSAFKDKSKYSRKQKHKRGNDE
jgi:hypothetical protein